MGEKVGVVAKNLRGTEGCGKKTARREDLWAVEIVQ